MHLLDDFLPTLEAMASRQTDPREAMALKMAIAALRPQPPLPGFPPDPPIAHGHAEIVSDAKWAKSLDTEARGADDAPLSDELLMRGAVAFGMLVRRGLFAPTTDMFARSYAVAMIAHNFADDPPCTPQRARLFSMQIGEVDDDAG